MQLASAVEDFQSQKNKFCGPVTLSKWIVLSSWESQISVSIVNHNIILQTPVCLLDKPLLLWQSILIR